MLPSEVRLLLTFDDVLLSPRRARSSLGTRSSPPASRATCASTSRCSARPWTRSPSRAPPSPWRRRAASASSTRAWPRQAGARGPEGEEVRGRPGGGPGDHRSGRAAVAGAGADARARHLRHPRHPGQAPGGHRHQPGRALRDPLPAEGGGGDDAQARHRPRGVSQAEAQQLLHQHRIEKLLVVDEDYALKGLITIKDIEKRRTHPNAAKDAKGGCCAPPRWHGRGPRGARGGAAARRLRRDRGGHGARALHRRHRGRARHAQNFDRSFTAPSSSSQGTWPRPRRRERSSRRGWTR